MNHHGMLMGSKSDAQRTSFLKAAIAVALAFVLTLSPGLAFATAGEQDAATANHREATVPVEDSDSSIVAAIDDDQESEDAASLDNAIESSEEGVAEEVDGAVSTFASDQDGVDPSEQSEPVLSSDETAATSLVAQSGPEFTLEGSGGDFGLTITADGSGMTTGHLIKFTFGTTNGANVNYTIEQLDVDLSLQGTTARYPEIDLSNGMRYIPGYCVKDGASFQYRFEARGTYYLTVFAQDPATGQQGRATWKFTINGAQSVSEKAQQIASNVMSQASDPYGRALKAHDALVALCQAEDKTGLRSGASGVLCYGSGTSESFHEAYALVLSNMYMVPGRAEANGRVWTLVQLDGSNWAHVDVAADATCREPGLDHLYFGLTDKQISRIRSGYTPLSHYAATNGDLNYYVRDEGAIAAFARDIRNNIDSQVNGGAMYFTVPTPQYETADAYLIMGENIAYYLMKQRYGGKGVIIQYVASGENNKSSYYQVTTKDLTSPYLSVSGFRDTVSANGQPQYHDLVLSLNGVPLTNGVDYAVSYESNVNPGTATMTVYGLNDFAGSFTRTFKIASSVEYPVIGTGTWKKSKGKWWFEYDGNSQSAQGKSWPADEWVLINGKRYHFDGSGWMHSKWLQLDNAWYWLSSDGALRTGWQKVKGKWYYLDPSNGAMKTGFYDVVGQRYYSNGSGAMQKGWKLIDGTWYHFKNSGAMSRGWTKVKGKWYWLDQETGKMKTSFLETGGKTYFLYSSGAMATGWLQILGNWYYFGKSGAMQKNKWISGKYWVGEDGAMATDTWVDNGRYYVDKNGKWVRGARR